MTYDIEAAQELAAQLRRAEMEDAKKQAEEEAASE